MVDGGHWPHLEYYNQCLVTSLYFAKHKQLLECEKIIVRNRHLKLWRKGGIDKSKLRFLRSTEDLPR